MDLVKLQNDKCIGLKAARFLILFASQTGNAKEIAETISEQCDAADLTHNISCTSESEKFLLEGTSCLVFVGSTTGDGDPPDTALKFWRSINKKNELRNAFAHLSYTVLGLGDTNYTNFCNFGKSVDQRFESLGAKRFYPCGWADDGTGLEIVVEPWIEGLIPILKNHLAKESCHGNQFVMKSDVSQASFDTDTNKNDLLVINKISSKMVNEISDEKISLIMEDSENNESSVDGSACDNVAKFGLCVLKQEQLEALSIKSCIFPADVKLSVPVLPAAYLGIRYKDDFVDNTLANFNIPLLNAASSVTDMNLISLKQLTAHNAVKTAYEITLQFTETGTAFEYLPGDSFGIVVKNPRAEVDLILMLLELSHVADKTYELTVDSSTKKKNASVPCFIPVVGTLQYVFENCVDFRSVPKKPLIRTLIEHTSDPKEKQRLKELVSKEGSKEYSKYVRECNLTILDLLIIFQSCKPPVTSLLEHLPQLQPRAYSAVSSPFVDPRKISFTFNVVEIEQKGTVTFPRKGICTGWLSSYFEYCGKDKDCVADEHFNNSFKRLTLLDKKEALVKVPIYLRSTQNFHLPKDNSVPIVMVGPGTGVAPFVGFLRHRQMMMQSSNENEFGESWLFYGCRHKNRDYLYREELEMFCHDKVLSHLMVCFSREEETNQSPKYVQDNIMFCGSKLTSLIVDKGAIIYVCGDAKNMAKDVFEVFTSILETNSGLSTIDARKYIAQMQIDKRYLQDVWS